MIDLHIHTQHSDGQISIIELLKLAEERKLDYISFTDHDEVSAYEELKDIEKNKYFSGKIIYGTELRFVYNHMQMEVLGYGYDYEKLKKSYWVQKESYYAIKKALLKNCLEKGKLIGLKYNELEYDPNEKPERTFYNMIIKDEDNRKILEKYEIKHSGDFFRKLIASPTSPMYFDSTDYSLTFEQAVDLIHSCGGIAVLAHPFGVYKIDDPKKTLSELIKKNKLDGLECMHANILPEQTEYLLDLCEKHNLVSTGGSDYHAYPGQYFAKSNYGQNDIPTDLINNFLNKVNKANIIK